MSTFSASRAAIREMSLSDVLVSLRAATAAARRRATGAGAAAAGGGSGRGHGGGFVPPASR